jgi:hypothetical protein
MLKENKNFRVSELAFEAFIELAKVINEDDKGVKVLTVVISKIDC